MSCTVLVALAAGARALELETLSPTVLLTVLEGRMRRNLAAPSAPPPATETVSARPSTRWREFRPEFALGEAVYLCREIGPRPGGGAAEARAAEHVANRLRQLGCQVAWQRGIALGNSGRTTSNVCAAVAGPRGAPRIVLGAHLDTRGAGNPGANDNASGVAVVLEAARLLAGEPLPYALEVVLFGAEELDGHGGQLRGSTYYAASARRSSPGPVVGMISVDMVGCGPELHAWHCAGKTTYLGSLLARSATALGVELETAARSSSDHAAFARAGIPSVWLQSLPDPRNHTTADQPQYLSTDALERAGRLLVHTFTALEAEDVRLLRSRCGNVTKVARRSGR